jgi:hypothetical protein
MSLKAFHIVFVCASCLLGLGFSAWGFWSYSARGGHAAHLAVGIGSLLATLALAFYGRYFLKKLKGISYL